MALPPEPAMASRGLKANTTGATNAAALMDFLRNRRRPWSAETSGGTSAAAFSGDCGPQCWGLPWFMRKLGDRTALFMGRRQARPG